jgi:hypothetical protein
MPVTSILIYRRPVDWSGLFKIICETTLLSADSCSRRTRFYSQQLATSVWTCIFHCHQR